MLLDSQGASKAKSQQHPQERSVLLLLTRTRTRNDTNINTGTNTYMGGTEDTCIMPTVGINKSNMGITLITLSTTSCTTRTRMHVRCTGNSISSR
jgi:hypothetical protein